MKLFFVLLRKKRKNGKFKFDPETVVRKRLTSADIEQAVGKFIEDGGLITQLPPQRAGLPQKIKVRGGETYEPVISKT